MAWERSQPAPPRRPGKAAVPGSPANPPEPGKGEAELTDPAVKGCKDHRSPKGWGRGAWGILRGGVAVSGGESKPEAPQTRQPLSACPGPGRRPEESDLGGHQWVRAGGVFAWTGYVSLRVFKRRKAAKLPEIRTIKSELNASQKVHFQVWVGAVGSGGTDPALSGRGPRARTGSVPWVLVCPGPRCCLDTCWHLRSVAQVPSLPFHNGSLATLPTATQ